MEGGREAGEAMALLCWMCEMSAASHLFETFWPPLGFETFFPGIFFTLFKLPFSPFSTVFIYFSNISLFPRLLLGFSDVILFGFFFLLSFCHFQTFFFGISLFRLDVSDFSDVLHGLPG